MKIRLFFLDILLLLFPAVCQAQDLNNRILMNIGGNKIQAGEFIRMYKKSTEPGTTLDIDTYVQQFVLFKLKVTDALSQGIDTTLSFRNELEGYRNQLAENYLTDTQAREKLLQKAYKRSLTEVNAWHILISMPQDASPDDTLRIWKKALDIRERIIDGEPFESVARGTSDDKSVKINGGNLGYFSTFQMIMPFEDAAYSLKTGVISMPVRTPYGYHIIKVTDRRPSKGKIRVAHIMKSVAPGADETEAKKAEDQINDIYKMLQSGASFSGLAIKYSDHQESAPKGGELDWFGTGDIVSDFSEAAFAIPDTGKYTKPVRTLYGWHIIKLLEKKSPGTFEESRSFLESKISQSYLNSVSRKAFIEKLKKDYKFQLNTEAVHWFISNTDTLIIQGLKKYDRANLPQTDIYSFANQNLTSSDFADYTEKRGFTVVTKDSAVFINKLIEQKADDQLIEYEKSILENKYPDFRYIISEFHDGMLLFEISSRNVWNRVTSDSAGLHKYYEENKSRWLSTAAIEAKLYTLKSTASENLLEPSFKKFADSPGFDDLLLKKFNKKNDTILFIKEGKWFKGENADIDNLAWESGLHSFKSNGYPSMIYIKRNIEPVPESFNNVKTDLLSGYQEYLETEWVKQLNKRYNVKIDNQVLEEVKKSLKK